MKALVLSGGAAFGAYQAGAWRALADADWRPQVAFGVSIGAVNAFAVSRGASPEEMSRLWLDLPAELAPPCRTNLWPWRKHVGLFREWVYAVHRRFAHRQQTCDFRAVLLEAPRMRFRQIEGPEASVEHLIAACALPGVLGPRRINGSWLLDAGALLHLPLREATDSGAAEIVSVDLLANHPVPAARMARKIALGLRDLAYGERSEPDPAELQKLNLIRVEHPGPLGSLLGSFEWRREHAAELIRLGREDAHGALFRAGLHPAPRMSA